MNKNPLISIITVSYNAEKEIERTIQSVLSQTYKNIEYIIVDGASTDGTSEIIESYKEKLAYFISEPDRGIYDAMNKGLKQATGVYVNFLNAGDVFKSIDTVENMMCNHNDADFVYGLAEVVDVNGEVRPWHKKTPSAETINHKSFLNGMVVCHQCFFTKRVLTPFYEVGLWKVSNDIDWSIKFMKRVKTIHFYDKIICTFLAGGFSNQKRKRAIRERFSILVHHFGFFPTLIEQIKTVFRKVLK